MGSKYVVLKVRCDMNICSIKLNGKGLKKPIVFEACVRPFILFLKKAMKIIKHFTNATKVKGHQCKLGRLIA